MKVRILAPLVVALALASLISPTTALAQDSPARRGGGIGYAAMLEGIDGLSMAYDFGGWHLDTIVDLWNHDRGAIAMGARLWLHVHTASAADISLGGGLGFLQHSPTGADETVVQVDFGAMIRAFVVPNVALSAFAGLAIRRGDIPAIQPTFQLDAQPVGALGLTYYFY